MSSPVEGRWIAVPSRPENGLYVIYALARRFAKGRRATSVMAEKIEMLHLDSITVQTEHYGVDVTARFDCWIDDTGQFTQTVA